MKLLYNIKSNGQTIWKCLNGLLKTPLKWSDSQPAVDTLTDKKMAPFSDIQLFEKWKNI